MNISDIMIHINESLSKEELSTLENAMRKIEASFHHALTLARNTC